MYIPSLFVSGTEDQLVVFEGQPTARQWLQSLMETGDLLVRLNKVGQVANAKLKRFQRVLAQKGRLCKHSEVQRASR